MLDRDAREPLGLVGAVQLRPLARQEIEHPLALPPPQRRILAALNTAEEAACAAAIIRFAMSTTSARALRCRSV